MALDTGSSDTDSTRPASRKGVPLWLIFLLCVVGVLLAVIALVSGIFHRRQQALRRSTVFSVAMTQASHASCVTARLGSPLVAHGFIVGSVRNDNAESYADIEIPVHGPRATGRIHIVANASGGAWKTQYLSLRTGSDRLLLLPAAPPCQ